MRRCALAFAVAGIALGGCDRGKTEPANGSAPATIAVAPTATRRPVSQAGPAAPRRVVFDPADAERLLVLEANGTTSIWSIADLTHPVKQTAIMAPAADARFVPGGRSIVTAGRNGSVYRWSDNGDQLWKSPMNKAVPLRALAVSADAALIASGGDDAAIRFWSADGAPLGSLAGAHKPMVISLAFSANGQWLASEGADSVARLWRRSGASFEPALVVRPATTLYDRMLPNLILWDSQWGWGQSVAFSPASDLLLTANLDGTAALWNLDGSPHAPPLADHGHQHVRAIAYSPAGDRVVSAGFDGTVRFWALDGTEAGVRLDHGAIVTSVAFAPDAARLATAAMDDRVRIWRADGALEGTLPAGAPPVPPRRVDAATPAR